MGPPVLTAALPGTPTVPGMVRPVLATQRPPRGMDLPTFGILATRPRALSWQSGGGCNITQEKIYEPWILEGTGTWEGHASLGIILQELSSSRRSRRQDVRHGNPIRQCRGFNSNRECAGPPRWVLLAAPSPMQPTELLTGPPLEGFSHGPWGCKGLGFWRWMPDGSSLPFWVGVPVCATRCLPPLACSLPRGTAAFTQRPLVRQPIRMPWSRCSMAWQAALPFLSASPARPRPLLSGCSSEIPVTGAAR